MNKTNKILWFVIALLVILNLATIGTIFYHNRQSKDDNQAIVLDENRPNPLTGRLFSGKRTAIFNTLPMI